MAAKNKQTKNSFQDQTESKAMFPGAGPKRVSVVLSMASGWLPGKKGSRENTPHPLALIGVVVEAE